MCSAPQADRGGPAGPCVHAAECARNWAVREFTINGFADRGMKPTDSQATMFVNIGRPAKNSAPPGEGRQNRARFSAVR